jgi:hypothetical protein
MLYSGTWGKLIHEKNSKSKISWHCPFKKLLFSLSSSQSLPLTTPTTVKTPFDGVKIEPWARPEEGLGKPYNTHQQIFFHIENKQFSSK